MGGILKNLLGVQHMSSREIAELTGKRHDNVRADVERMARELSLNFQEKSEPSEGGRPLKVYLLPKRETLILVSGYNLEMRARIIDRWTELESRPAFDPMLVLEDPGMMRDLLLIYTDKVIALEGTVATLAPKAEALDHIAGTEGSYAPTDAAKTLGIRPKELFAYLRGEARWVYRRAGTSEDVAYQDKIQRGLMEHKVNTVHREDGSEKTVTRARITAKGLANLALVFGTSFA